MPSAAHEDPAAFYTAGYSLEDHERSLKMGRWRAIGARSKAAHAVELCSRAGLSPARVVEIGCGDGALLAELSVLWPGARFDGFELSAPAIEIARAREIPRVERLEAYDGARVPVSDRTYDVAILSHVVEHIPDPAPVIAEAARVARHVLVEVPLENNRSGMRPAKRAISESIGHLHAFDRSAVRGLVTGAGLRVVGELADPLARDHHAFFAETPRARAAATAKWAVRAGLHGVSPARAERLFTVHYAVLAQAA